MSGAVALMSHKTDIRNNNGNNKNNKRYSVNSRYITFKDKFVNVNKRVVRCHYCNMKEHFRKVVILVIERMNVKVE